MRLLECELERTGSRMANLWSLVKGQDDGVGFWADLARHNRQLLKTVAETCMLHWREQYVRVGWHQVDPDRRADQCNGFYSRKSWPTPIGPLENVRVPRCRRKGLGELMTGRIGDGLAQVAGQVTELMVAGVSTRRVNELMQTIIGLPVSAGSASRLAKKLDAEAALFHSRPISDEFVYLILDGVHLKARGEKPSPTRRRKFVPRKRIVLVAYGITIRGHRQLIDFALADSESAEACSRFLWNLYHRGLAGGKLKLIVSDRGGGLTAAAEEVWPFVAKQACWFHKIKNILGHIRKADQGQCMSGLRKIYDAANGKAARAAARQWAARWTASYPKAVVCLTKDLQRLLAIYSIRPEHRRMMRTTNAIERFFREVRRRTDSVGTFLDDASIHRLVYGQFAHWNARWAGQVCKEFKNTKLAA